MAKRLTLILAGGLLWLFILAIPALADAGPHRQGNGVTPGSGSCASCHRIHTGQAAGLLVEEQPALCFECHGTQGAELDVKDGTFADFSGVGLRGGGFEFALLNPSNADASGWQANPNSYAAIASNGYVDVLPGTGTLAAITSLPVTSAHTNDGSLTSWSVNAYQAGTGVDTTLWGWGAVSDGAGKAPVQLACASCHNPHGNATYRILRPAPSVVFGGNAFDVTSGGGTPVTIADGSSDVTTTLSAAIDASVTTVNVVLPYRFPETAPAAGLYIRIDSERMQVTAGFGTSTWTVTRAVGGTAAAAHSSGATVTQVSSTGTVSTGKDYGTLNYWKVASADSAQFQQRISGWCATCHTRYLSPTNGAWSDSGDPIFAFQHYTPVDLNPGGTTVQAGMPICIQCHVSHGSPARTQRSDSVVAWPDGTQEFTVEKTAADTPGTNTGNPSRLLRLDRRYICSMCHLR